MAKEYTLHSLKIGTTTHIPVNQSSIDPGIQALVEGAGSSIDSTVVGLVAAQPVCNFTTPALGTALAACGVAGVSAGDDDIVLYFVKLVSGASYSASADCVSLTIKSGHCTLQRINGDKDSAATAEYQVFITYDGTNAPIVLSAADTAPTVTALAELYTLYCVTSTTSAPVTTQFPVDNAVVDNGIEEFHERTASGPYPTMAAIKMWKPRATWSTPAVKVALDVCGIDNLSCTNTIVYFGKLDTGGTFASGANHVSCTLSDPLVAFRGLDARHPEPATVNFEAFGVYDDTNDPLTEPLIIAVDAELPAASALAELFTCGPAIFDGATSFETKSISLDTGLNVIHEGDSGDHRPDIAAVTRRDPRLTIDVQDIGQLPVMGQTDAGALLYLRKVDEDGTRVAVAAEEHIKITLTAAMSHTGSTSGSFGGDPASQTITLIPIKDGANDVVKIETTKAIA